MPISHKTEIIIAVAGVGVSIVGIVLYQRGQSASNASAQENANALAQQESELSQYLQSLPDASGSSGSAPVDSSTSASFDPTAGGLLSSGSASTSGGTGVLTTPAQVTSSGSGDVSYSAPSGFSSIYAAEEAGWTVDPSTGVWTAPATSASTGGLSSVQGTGDTPVVPSSTGTPSNASVQSVISGLFGGLGKPGSINTGVPNPAASSLLQSLKTAINPTITQPTPRGPSRTPTSTGASA